MLGAVAFVFFGAYQSYSVYSYTQNDPTFCRSCHTMEKAWTRWQSSEHSKVTCHACHESSPISSMEQVVKYAMKQPNEVSKHALVSDEACKKCHEGTTPEWLQVEDTAGHKVHAVSQRISCLKCHSVTLHRFTPPEKICLVCHGEKQMKITAMAERYCLDCHNFLREGSPLRPLRQDCLNCHQPQAAKEIHWPSSAPMQFQCSQCHQPHKQEKPVVFCQSCHQRVPTEGKHTVNAHTQASCTACHKPHEWKVTTREACTSCHENKATHNPGAFCASCHSFKT